MNQKFPIKNELAQKIWNHFEKELEHKIKALPELERNDVKLEILSHLYESSINDEAEKEENRVINAIERLGSPDEYLTPLVSDILIHLKAKNGNPIAIAKSLTKNIQRSLFHTFITIIFGVSYLFCLMLFIMAIAHLFNPEVGVWLHETGGLSLSFEAQKNSTQWLPKWFSLIAFVSSALVYFILNKILYRLITKKPMTSSLLKK
jgi:uncharacterized membrane protein